MPPSTYTLDFEKPLQELERQIEELERLGEERQIDVSTELKLLQDKLVTVREDIYKGLTPIQRVMVARHPRRPYTLDYLSTIFTDVIELHGDRLFMDDPSIVGGWARLGGTSVMVIGHQKGRDTKENIKRNFGMPHPEGYRKALRLMKLAARFDAPVITLIDTPGAYPGLGPRSAASPRPSRATSSRCRYCRRRSSASSSARAARAARSRSAWPTGS